ncbi:hypothetical protein MNBD_GAMMA12-3769 [hydrothermal vent metagenome]|uniref:Flagellar protein FliT n=1 Tax=hydrothermal vent metagenome TaxID=652676 RepID=A0A3B0YF98_9ZZZZ
MDKDSLVKEIMNITCAMLEDAKTGKWDYLSAMESRRKEWLEEYFVGPVEENHAKQAAELVRSVLKADKELIALVNNIKKQYSQEHSALKEGHKATTAYQLNQK